VFRYLNNLPLNQAVIAFLIFIAGVILLISFFI